MKKIELNDKNGQKLYLETDKNPNILVVGMTRSGVTSTIKTLLSKIENNRSSIFVFIDGKSSLEYEQMIEEIPNSSIVRLRKEKGVQLYFVERAVRDLAIEIELRNDGKSEDPDSQIVLVIDGLDSLFSIEDGKWKRFSEYLNFILKNKGKNGISIMASTQRLDNFDNDVIDLFENKLIHNSIKRDYKKLGLEHKKLDVGQIIVLNELTTTQFIDLDIDNSL